MVNDATTGLSRKGLQMRRFAYGLIVACLGLWQSGLLPAAAGAGEVTADPFSDVFLLRQVNLAVNPGFEVGGTGEEVAEGWLPSGENQLPDWERASYEAYRRGEFVGPQVDRSAARSGRRGLRLLGAGTTTSAVWQKINLLQREPRPIVLGAWSRLDGTGGWAELGMAHVRYADGTREDLDRREPLVKLGAGPQWEFRYALFEPRKPVRSIEVMLSLHDAGLASAVAVDDVLVAEVDATVADLEARGLEVPAPVLSAVPTHPVCAQEQVIQFFGDAGRGAGTAAAAVSVEALPWSLALLIRPFTPLEDGETLEVSLAPYDRRPFDAPQVADFYRVRVRQGSTPAFAWAMTRNESSLAGLTMRCSFLSGNPCPKLPPSSIPQVG